MQWILIGYMFLFIHRPFEIWPALGDMHLERIYALGAMLAVAVYPGKRWLPNVQHFAYLLFWIAVAVCWIASPWANYSQDLVENYFKIVVFYILFMFVIHDERSLRRFLLAFLAIMFIYMLHSLREYVGGRYTFRMGIARMIGVDKSLGDPNSFGASIVYALPFVVPFWLDKPSRWLRAFLVAYVGLSLVCIGLTGSRSSFIGLVLCCLLIVLRSRKRFAMLVLVVLAAPMLWMALPASMQTRFETIINPEVGPANAQSSAMDRIEGLKIGFQLYEKNPVTGIGPWAWKPATKRDLESHNLYGELLGEMGTLGALTFAGVLIGFFVNWSRIRKAYQQHPEWGKDFLYHVNGAIALAVILLLFEGNFGHNLFRYSWLWYGGFLIITRYCVQQRLQEAAIYAYQPQPVQAPQPLFGYAGM
jgi:O-antigen ligase